MKAYNIKLDYWGLLNLHKALLEAKFHTTPDNEYVAGSPLIANIYIQVRDLLIESDKGSQWKDWFQLSNRPDRKHQAVTLIRKCDEHWNKATADEKSEIAANYLAPFLFNDEELKNVIREVDGML
ncbi:hypothetical protein [Pseudoflavonifractor phocaeensis]|uniref:hypothetical protein n=1 Tax=Pseudoflavonifractor phocaeensis TaxID=1870988 RepID=UPI00195B5521|nr:hypothetical protein [Pseudoflavonifractor phocaeensis]MBM6888365.1 hypothetical protein [Pseudoflavonifractor phocaeensis]